MSKKEEIILKIKEGPYWEDDQGNFIGIQEHDSDEYYVFKMDNGNDIGIDNLEDPFYCIELERHTYHTNTILITEDVIANFEIVKL